jgi:hypothetical protein
MKQNKLNPRYVTAVAIASFAALVSACGSSNGSSTSGIGGIGGIGGVGNQCTPLSQQMSFTGYAGYVDSANLFAGTQLSGSPYTAYDSQLGLGAGGGVGAYQFMNTVMPAVDGGGTRLTSDLTFLGLNITSTGGYNVGTTIGGTYTGYPTTGVQGQTMIQGSFQFSQSAWATLAQYFPQLSYGSYTTGYATGSIQSLSACSIGINSGLISSNITGQPGTLFSGYIVMTINGQPFTFKI